MSGEAEALPALTLLLAVCEQSLHALEGVSPPDAETTELVERLRDRLSQLLKSGRFSPY
jgi:hypothetical protein